jgi:hypothetical protein
MLYHAIFIPQHHASAWHDKTNLCLITYKMRILMLATGTVNTI